LSQPEASVLATKHAREIQPLVDSGRLVLQGLPDCVADQ
jgi:hypothetical protein